MAHCCPDETPSREAGGGNVALVMLVSIRSSPSVESECVDAGRDTRTCFAVSISHTPMGRLNFFTHQVEAGLATTPGLMPSLCWKWWPQNIYTLKQTHVCVNTLGQCSLRYAVMYGELTPLFFQCVRSSEIWIFVPKFLFALPSTNQSYEFSFAMLQPLAFLGRRWEFLGRVLLFIEHGGGLPVWYSVCLL